MKYQTVYIIISTQLRNGRLIDADKVENITWQEPYYHDALNVLSEVRDKVRELPTIIEADKGDGGNDG